MESVNLEISFGEHQYREVLSENYLEFHGHIPERIVLFLDCLFNYGIIIINGFPYHLLLRDLRRMFSIQKDSIAFKIQDSILLSEIRVQETLCCIQDNILEVIHVYSRDISLDYLLLRRQLSVKLHHLLSIINHLR